MVIGVELDDAKDERSAISAPKISPLAEIVAEAMPTIGNWPARSLPTSICTSVTLPLIEIGPMLPLTLAEKVIRKLPG